MQTAILVHRLGKSFEAGFGDCRANVVALSDVDLDVAFGELAVVVGSTGSGKTTLLRIVAGLLEPTAGSIFRSAPVVLGSRRVENPSHDDGTVKPPAILVCDDAFDRPFSEVERFFDGARRAGHAVLASARSAEGPQRLGARIVTIERGRLVEPRAPVVVGRRQSRIAEGVDRRPGY